MIDCITENAFFIKTAAVTLGKILCTCGTFLLKRKILQNLVEPTVTSQQCWDECPYSTSETVMLFRYWAALYHSKSTRLHRRRTGQRSLSSD